MKKKIKAKRKVNEILNQGKYVVKMQVTMKIKLKMN